MRKLNLYLVAAFASIVLLSCSHEESIMDDKTNPGVEKYSPQEFAKTLAKSLKNEKLRDFIKTEVSKQRDGDYEVLIAEVINREIVPESGLRSGNATTTFRNCLFANEIDLRTASSDTKNIHGYSSSLEYTLNDLENNYPLLQIAVPNMETASWESIASGKDPFFVAFLPFDYEEGDDVLAYDQDGNEHILDGKNEPATPVIVISQSERITSVLSAEDAGEYQDLEKYFATDNRTYYSLGYNKNDDEANTAPVNLRSYVAYPTIWKAAFASQSAMRKYEPWTKGRAEVAVSMANGINININTDHNEFNSKGWWDGNENVLNYHVKIPFNDDIFNGNVMTRRSMYFGWWELDYEFSLKKKTQSVPVYNSGGIKFNIIIPIGWLGDSNDFIGYNVAYSSLSRGQKYVTEDGKHGSGDFYFWLY